MTTVNYPTPILVNGYSCRNCTDVEYAKRNVDPQNPKDGPFGINKTREAGGAGPGASGLRSSPAVVLGGVLANVDQPQEARPDPNTATGLKLDLKV